MSTLPKLSRSVVHLETVKTRRVVDAEFALALLADVFSLEKNVHGTVESVAMRNIRTIKPALVAKFLQCKRQPLLIDFEAKVNLSPLDVFLGQMLRFIASSKIFPGAGSGKSAIVRDSLD